MTPYKEIIIHLINVNHGLIRKDLSLKVMEWISPGIFNAGDYFEALDELILDGEILELPFTTPETINGHELVRSNNVYFPKGTRICVTFFNGNNGPTSSI